MPVLEMLSRAEEPVPLRKHDTAGVTPVRELMQFVPMTDLPSRLANRSRYWLSQLRSLLSGSGSVSGPSAAAAGDPMRRKRSKRKGPRFHEVPPSRGFGGGTSSSSVRIW
jgi:hypothetical protein